MGAEGAGPVTLVEVGWAGVKFWGWGVVGGGG